MDITVRDPEAPIVTPKPGMLFAHRELGSVKWSEVVYFCIDPGHGQKAVGYDNRGLLQDHEHEMGPSSVFGVCLNGGTGRVVHFSEPKSQFRVLKQVATLELK